MHNMILDLIVSKAVEIFFITSIGDQTHTSVSQDKVRRLSVDYRGQENLMSWSSMISSHVQSLSIFGYSEKMLPISNFQALRMLDRDSRVKLQNNYLRKLGDLFQLRYLRIAARRLTHLPDQIGELQFLETLDLCRTWIRKLPASIVKLRWLNLLSVNGSQLLDGVRNMQSLEELSGVSVYDACSIDSLQELGSLTNLRALRLTWHISESRNDRTTYTDILAS
uniref:Disease resistance R13L4/SHOC-2-like LRR domain-containing protein n=1 Tax=Arundo donax TaxID=35708 RepID=A0A0A9CA58_ARUDO